MLPMHLEIVVRVHDGVNIHGVKPRYINVPKKDLVIGCLSSLINSANITNNTDISFIVLNDHCTEDCILEIKKIFKQSINPCKIINLEVAGFNHSALKQFEHCRDSTADLVYSVEDDYLHCPSSISEMVGAYVSLKRHYDLKEVCIFPYDTPQEYEFNPKEEYLITRGKYRHWKSSTWTTQTFMTSPTVFRNHWFQFEKLAKEFKVIPRKYKGKIEDSSIVWEDTTLGNIWRSEVPVFHPIPSLALHVQFEKERDPFINHHNWWDQYTQIKKSKKFAYR